MSTIKYYTIVYSCHLCSSTNFFSARNLRDHYGNIEGIKYPSTRSRRYNTKSIKYVSDSIAKSKQNVSENFGCPSCTSHFDTVIELGYHLDEIHTAKPRAEVEESFRALRNNDKWTLSTGTVVEDNLYAFGKLQIGDHPSQSFIFDVNDSELYIKHGIFTSEEIEEIMTDSNNLPLQLPDDFKQYLNKFNCKSTVDIRKALLQKESWEDSYDQDKHFDLDWIKQSIHMLVQEYELGSFANDHSENWYNIHLWCIIDRCFGNLKGIEVIRGEGASMASAVRKNAKRTLEDVNNSSRKNMGRRFDFLIRENRPKSSNSLEYGAAELPRVLKDMLDMLIQEKQGDASNLCTFGVVHSGLHMQLISVDRPNGYTTRVNEGKPLRIPIDVESFGEKVLPILVQVYQLKQLVRGVYQKVRLSSTTSLNNANWLDHCLNKRTRIIIPATSSSTETFRAR
ncbi:hypothetical protein PS15p_210597 [Mucor circinelloides]